MKKISCYFLLMLAFSVYAQEQKLLVVSNIEELISVKAKEIFWQKDQAIMGLIPSSDVTKPSYMDIHEGTVRQFRNFVNHSGYDWWPNNPN